MTTIPMVREKIEEIVRLPGGLERTVRELRKAKLISTGKTGAGAARATPIDAARLLIAALSLAPPRKIVEAVEKFRQLPADGNFCVGAVEIAHGDSLEVAIAALIANGTARDGIEVRLDSTFLAWITETGVDATQVFDGQPSRRFQRISFNAIPSEGAQKVLQAQSPFHAVFESKATTGALGPLLRLFDGETQ